MTINVAINGFGRIGRCIARALFENSEFSNIKLVAINASTELETLKHLLKYDSIHNKFSKKVEVSENSLIIDGQQVTVVNNRDPQNLPWKKLKIDLVFECTGAFTKHNDASKHITAGAKKVIISAPAKEDSVKTIVYGVNEDLINSEDKVISIGSCTTNCLAPIAKILNNTIGIEKGLMTTIHAYTNDQNIVDNAHKDLRRARAASMSMIPTSTGAAKAIGLVIPELKGKLDGVAVRVPTPNVSMVDLTFISKKDTNIEEINKIVTEAVNSKVNLKRAVEIVDEPLVSIDFNHNSFSSCFDKTQTKVLGNNLVKIASWYDNEWAFSIRMIDVAKLMHQQ
ncbi:MAG: type I glyceraldehyde-3-phosphate dehydrogenase [Rickettsiales bacterium]|nr:type I glyceraldehyde-3-phosphate dehydrogenase [Rickettsiales bacterium]